MKRIALASLFAVGLAAGAAQAQAQAQPQALLAAAGGNVVGGGSAAMAGGGEDRTITYAAGGAGGGASLEQAGRAVAFAGSDGDGPRWSHGAPTAEGAGREAWLRGGGDDAEVVYTRPR